MEGRNAILISEIEKSAVKLEFTTVVKKTIFTFHASLYWNEMYIRSLNWKSKEILYKFTIPSFFLKKVSRKRKILLIVKGEISEIFEILKSRKFEINLINPLESKKFVFTSNWLISKQQSIL